MSENCPYKTFQNFVLRTPLYPVNFVKQLSFEKNISRQDIKRILKENAIQEALFLASPQLYGELQKWLTGKIKDKKKRKN